MNAERLLQHYERIADAPDAIARLRRFILDLAVRGKLVPQDPKDAPASDLLKRIAKEKARLVKAGEIRKRQPLPAITADEIPFELPYGWAWTRLGDVIHLVSGQHLQPPEYSEDPKDGLPYITGPSDFAADGLEISRFALVRKAVAKKGQLLLTVKGSGVGKTTICDIPEVAISRQLMALTAIEWNHRFLSLITHRLAEKLQAEARSLIPGISREDVDEFVVLLPPLAEQHRIVAKVDELMGLCDRLEAAREAREATRDRLTAASLARLNAPDPETFQADARFALDALPALTTRPDQIKRLRQTILSLAVRGKLVPQDPNDEPALDLLKRIAKEKAATGRAGSSRETQSIAHIEATEENWDLPSSWRKVSVSDVLLSSFYGPRFGADEYISNGVPTIRTTDMTEDGRIVLRDPPTVSIPESRLLDFQCLPGDLLVTRTGSIGTMAVFDGDYVAVPSAYLIRLRFSKFVDVRYLHISLRSPSGQEALGLGTTRVAQPNINAKTLSALPISLPPLTEQDRIVAKVDELMALCDRLEASLTATADTRRCLLDALVAQALAPADARELEAAE